MERFPRVPTSHDSWMGIAVENLILQTLFNPLSLSTLLNTAIENFSS